MANSRGSLWDQSTQRLTVQDSANENVNRFLSGLVEWAKIERPFDITQEGEKKNPLVVRLHNYPGGHLLYVLNHGKTKEKAKIRIKVPEEGTYSLEEILQNRKTTVKSLKREVIIETSDISVKNGELWKIEKLK